jgi:hypothetical protein
MTRVIGSQSDVPDVGDPIVSPWHQSTANKLVHPFATTTARDAWTSPPNGAVCVTTDTNTTWRRQTGVWVEDLKVFAKVQTVTTDGFSNAVISTTHGIPSTAKVISATAVGAQRDFPFWCVLNTTDQPLGGNAVAFKLVKPDGSGYNNTTVTLSVVIVYRTY